MLLFIRIFLLVLTFTAYSCASFDQKSNIDNHKITAVVQLGHSVEIKCGALSPDGRLVLSGSSDGTIKLWSLSTGREMRTLWEPPKGLTTSPKGIYNVTLTVSVNSVTFSPDGRFVLSGNSDGTMILWEVNTGKKIKKWRGHSKDVNSVAFSQDGVFAASGGSDGLVKLWKMPSGRRKWTFFDNNSTKISSVTFSPDGRFLLTGGVGCPVILWSVSSGKKIKTFSDQSPTQVGSVAFSPDGKHILSGTHDGLLNLWNVSSGHSIRSFTGHSSFINAVAFSPHGHLVISGSSDETAKIWNIKTGDEIQTLKGGTDVLKSNRYKAYRAISFPDNVNSVSFP